jgi:hypothetical protein
MWAQLRRFSALPRPAKALFLRAAVILPFLSLLLHFRDFRYTRRFLQRLLRARENPIPTVAGDPRVALTSRMVQAAARHSPISSTCLERSLALWWLLARQGIAAQLRIGVRKDGEKFAAHAWVEHEGVAVGEPEDTHIHYTAFAEEMSGDIS